MRAEFFLDFRRGYFCCLILKFLITYSHMTSQPKQPKSLPLKSRVLNANTSNNQQVQNYQKQTVEKAKKDIVKIEDEIKQLEQTQ